jgi:L-alanine-DL-glutamate epimerase-like enolase superfamily enzyme
MKNSRRDFLKAIAVLGAASSRLPRAGKAWLCMSHSAHLAMVTVFTLHMLGSISKAGSYIEYSIEPTKWTEGLYYPELQVTDGMVAIPDGPGWGVTINPKWLPATKRQQSEL